MNTYLYCIEHEDFFPAVETPLGLGHEHATPIDRGLSFPEWAFDFCEFPSGWATCPPPEQDPEWIDRVTEPEPGWLTTTDVDGETVCQYL